MSGRRGGGARRWRRAAVAVLVAATVAGCASLPDHSAVSRGRGEGARGVQADLTYRPRGPVAGAGREAITRGYLDAMLASPSDPTIVRAFLTPTAASSWNPDKRLLVYQSTTVSAPSALGVTVEAVVLGHIDTRGSWTSATPSDDSLTVSLTFSKVDGQWRIANPVPGTMVDTDFFERHLHQYSMYFFDPKHVLLSPDPVYLPVGHASATANALVNDLLGGPTPAMDGVVQAEVPAGTRLARPVVVSSSRLAEIDLSAQARAMSSAEDKFFAAELVWTLRQKRLGVSRIRLLVAGQVLRIPGLDPDFSVEDLLGYNPSGFSSTRSLYALSSGHLVTVALSSGASKTVVPAGRLGALKATARSAAVQLLGQNRGAVVVDNGTRVVVGSVNQGDTEANAVWFQGADDLLAPSWDVHGVLWLVDRTPRGAVLRVMTGPENVRQVTAPGISGHDVRAFSVSPDGTRLAALVGSGDNSHLVIAMIERSAQQRLTLSVLPARTVQNAQYPLLDLSRLAWYSPTSVAVLAQDQGGEPQPYQISIDGSRVVPTTGFLPVLPVSLAAVGDPGDPDVPLVVGTKQGRLYFRNSAQEWVPLESRALLYQPVYSG